MPIPNYDNEELRIMRYNMMEPCHISSQFGLFGQPEFLVSAHHRQCGTTCLYVPRCVPKTCLPYKKYTHLYQKSTPRTKNMYQKHSAYQLLRTQITSDVQRYVPEFCGLKIFFLYITDQVQLENGI